MTLLLRSLLTKPGHQAASEPDAGQGPLAGMIGRIRTPLLAATAWTILLVTGCSSMSEDFQDFTEKFNPPSPFQAAVWASDFNDPGLQRRGVILLSNATFGGERTYVDLYRVLASESSDPLVRAAGIRALGRWGSPSDAVIIANQLESEFQQVRLEAAIALQRIHQESVEDQIWRRLVDVSEDEAIRVELAIALGQYPTDSAFQALALTLEDRSLAMNLAAADSLRVLTGDDFGIDGPAWLSWYDATNSPFSQVEIFLYPTFQRPLTFFEKLAFWDPTVFEKPAPPRGLDLGEKSTYDIDVDSDAAPAKAKSPSVSTPTDQAGEGS
ncbi:MAG: HEAT repeat domain-containing protein [Planctomycetota bacterium]|nr:HEAT repeat domain-containing protein [Planctomycetota bacterium]